MMRLTWGKILEIVFWATVVLAFSYTSETALIGMLGLYFIGHGIYYRANPNKTIEIKLNGRKES